MDGSSLTYALILMHLCLYLFGFWLTRRPWVTVFHVVLGAQILAFVVRPFLAGLKGGYTLYPTVGAWSAYNRGLIYQLLFAFSYILGYLVFLRRQSCGPFQISTTVVRGYWVSLGLGISSVVVIHVLSGGAWLPGVRSVTLTSVTPFGKLLFPLAVIPLSMSLVLAAVVFQSQRRQFLRLVVGGIVALILLTLLYQRGFVLLALIATVFLWERRRGINFGWVLSTAAVLLVVLATMRPLAELMSGGTPIQSDTRVGWRERIESFLLGPNFDYADVWPVAIASVERDGLLLGGTFLSLPARFLTPAFRREIGVFTAVDRLNDFYWGEYYWTSNFGFNVTLAQELYMNFGPAFFLVGFVPGMLCCMVDRWLWSVKRVGVVGAYLVVGAFASGGFIGELGGEIQWGLAYVGLGMVVGVLARLRVRR